MDSSYMKTMKFWAKLKKPAGLTWFQRLALFFYDKPRATIGLWLVIFLFGFLSYSTLLKREGFPSVQIPFTVVTGTYLVGNAEKVDSDVAKPLSEIGLKQPDIKTVRTNSQANYFLVFLEYQSGTDPAAATKRFEASVKKAAVIPPQAEAKFDKARFGITERGDDVVISLYAKNNDKSTEQLAEKAASAADFIKSRNLDLVQDSSIINPFVSGTDPATGRREVRQATFDRYGQRQNGQIKFYDSVIIGISAKPGADVLKLNEQVQSAVSQLNRRGGFNDYRAVISATLADDIQSQIDELQQALLEGLAAVLLVGAVIIALRPAILTVLSMLSVLAATIATLLLIGYSLNTITLFALILGLALIVDDTIIMVEAIDAQRRRQKDGRKAVKTATRRVGRAMVAATSTAVLSFAPLIFVSGILGDFIRAIPVTIITSLLISLAVALVFIPRFARSLMLSPRRMGPRGEMEVAAGVEAAIARALAKPMMWAKGSFRRLLTTGLAAVVVGLGFTAAGGWLFSKVTFNIFPSTKDSNTIIVSMTYPPGTSVPAAASAGQKAEAEIIKQLGSNFVRASYYGTGNDQRAVMYIDLISYNRREATAPELIKKLETAFKNFPQARVKISQSDAGPPQAQFSVQIKSDNKAAAYRLANDLSRHLNGHRLMRPSGKAATITSANASNPATISRSDNRRFVEVTADFDGTDTSTLVSLAQTHIKSDFNAQKLKKYGLDKQALNFNLGQEQENQDSFKTLTTAFPLLLGLIYILLALQFKSLLQPALIFLAIPFSLLGIALGLYLTDNPFSFFAMLGFFALIGLSIKNTILLTDYANQAKAAGMGAVDSAVEALQERFRPLIATSLTAVVSLIPLAILSPFWEGLVVVLIFGLLSSTFLVVTVFPYYYLGAELLRRKFSRRGFFTWLALNAAATIAISKLSWAAVVAALAALNAGWVLLNAARKRRVI